MSRWKVNLKSFPGKITRYKEPSPPSPPPDMSTNQPIRSQSPEQEENNLIQDVASLNALSIRFDKFQAILSAPVIDLVPLRKLAWSGIPGKCWIYDIFIPPVYPASITFLSISYSYPTPLDEIRGTVWKLLLSYLPTASQRRDTTLARKRSEYTQLMQAPDFFSDELLLHQVKIDVARTLADVALFQSSLIRSVCFQWLIKGDDTSVVLLGNKAPGVRIRPRYCLFIL